MQYAKFFSFLGSLKEIGHFFWQKLQTYLSSTTCHTKISLFISSQASSKIYRCLGLSSSCKTSLYKQEKVRMSAHWRNLIATPFFFSIRDRVLALYKSDTKPVLSFISFENPCDFLSFTLTKWPLYSYARNTFPLWNWNQPQSHRYNQ